MSRVTFGGPSIQGKAKYFSALVLACLAISAPLSARAEPLRDFVVSCSYGVLAGTLVGAASLAFSDKPGENLNMVARGASLGLYSGILLGAYIVYGVPTDEDEAALIGAGLRESGSSPRRGDSRPSWLMGPIMGSAGIEGVQGQWRVAEF